MFSVLTSLFFGSSLFLLSVTLWQKARWLFFTPTNEADWTKDQTQLQTVAFGDDGRCTVYNLRDVRYRTSDDYDVVHTDKEFDVTRIKKLWLVQSIFGVGAAHVFFSFEFENGDFLPISIEIRKKVGASFGWRVLFKPFELMYIAATEADVLRTRLCDRKDEQVFIYEMHVPKEVLPRLLADILERMNTLAEKPHFYDIIGENCTSLPFWHMKKVWRDAPLPWWDWRYVVSSKIDELLRSRGLIDAPIELSGKEVCGVPREEFSRALRG